MPAYAGIHFVDSRFRGNNITLVLSFICIVSAIFVFCAFVSYAEGIGTVSKMYCRPLVGTFNCENNENSNVAEQSSALQIVLTQSPSLREWQIFLRYVM